MKKVGVIASLIAVTVTAHIFLVGGFTSASSNTYAAIELVPDDVIMLRATGSLKQNADALSAGIKEIGKKYVIVSATPIMTDGSTTAMILLVMPVESEDMDIQEKAPKIEG